MRASVAAMTPAARSSGRHPRGSAEAPERGPHCVVDEGLCRAPPYVDATYTEGSVCDTTEVKFKMDLLRHLHYFVAVAEERHFGRAAESLHMAQPPLSQQIRGTRGRVGVQLLRRTTRRVDLTQAGAAYLQPARAILASVENAADEASASPPGRRPPRHRVRRVRDLQPAPALSGDSPTSCRASTSPSAARCSSPPRSAPPGRHHRHRAAAATRPRPGALGSGVLRQDGLVVALAADHPLARRRRLRVADLGADRARRAHRVAAGRSCTTSWSTSAEVAGFEPSLPSGGERDVLPGRPGRGRPGGRHARPGSRDRPGPGRESSTCRWPAPAQFPWPSRIEPIGTTRTSTAPWPPSDASRPACDRRRFRVGTRFRPASRTPSQGRRDLLGAVRRLA